MSGRQPPGHPRLPDPAYGSHPQAYDRDPFTPGPPSTVSHGQYYDQDSDMDHGAFERRDTFQSEGSAHNLVEEHRGDPRYYDHQQQYDPYGTRDPCSSRVFCSSSASPAQGHRHRVRARAAVPAAALRELE
jgi:hypothetical protein